MILETEDEKLGSAAYNLQCYNNCFETATPAIIKQVLKITEGEFRCSTKDLLTKLPEAIGKKFFTNMNKPNKWRQRKTMKCYK